MTRPIGEIRQALLQAVEQVPRGTFLDLARHVPGVNLQCRSERQLVNFTCKNLVKAGVLEAVDKTRVPGISRPVTVYAPKRRTGWVTNGASLWQAIQRWLRG